MAKARINKLFSLEAHPNVKAGIVHWPMSVVRLQSSHLAPLVEAADFILKKWKSYSDQSAGILALQIKLLTIRSRLLLGKEGFVRIRFSTAKQSNKQQASRWHLSSACRSSSYQKENIGLIEVMGLAVLPGRLKDEMSLVAKGLVQNNLSEVASRHDQVKNT